MVGSAQQGKGKMLEKKKKKKKKKNTKKIEAEVMVYLHNIQYIKRPRLDDDVQTELCIGIST